MKEINALKKSIKTFSFVFSFILMLYPIKGLFAYMENDLTYLGLITNDSLPVFLWMKFIIKFASHIIFFIGIFHLIKTLNFEDIKDLFSSKKILLFKKTGTYFLKSAGLGSLVSLIDIFDGKFASLQSNTDFIFILYFSFIIGFFFYLFSKVLQAAKELKQENDLTI
jgi:hypothetical protein